MQGISNFNLFLIILLFTILPNVLSYKKRFDTILKCVEKRIGGGNTKAYINRILHGENKAKKWEIIKMEYSL